MEESFIRLVRAVRQFPCRFGTVQHNCRAEHIRLNEYFRVYDASVNMALRRKMYDSVDVVFLKNTADGIFIADVRFDKSIIFSVFNAFEIFKVARIGQGIHIDNSYFVIIFSKHIVNIIGTDKTGAARYKVSSHSRCLLSASATELSQIVLSDKSVPRSIYSQANLFVFLIIIEVYTICKKI